METAENQQDNSPEAHMCDLCGTLFNTHQGVGNHKRECKRKRPWQREHYRKTGHWPKPSKLLDSPHVIGRRRSRSPKKGNAGTQLRNTEDPN